MKAQYEQAYLNQEQWNLDSLPESLALIWKLHWSGQLREAHEQYLCFFSEAKPVPNGLYDLARADHILVGHKIGVPFPKDLQASDFSTNLSKTVFLFSRYQWAFWVDHRIARRSIIESFSYGLASPWKSSVFVGLFMFGHISVIGGNAFGGYFLASLMFRLQFAFERIGLGWVTHTRDLINVGYPYTLFVAGKLSKGRLEKVLKRVEPLVPQDGYLRTIYLISSLYGYAYSGNIAKTEILAKQLGLIQTKVQLLRYKPVIQIMTQLPYAFRGYRHLIEKKVDSLVQSHNVDKSDPLINSQFYRASALIYLIFDRREEAKKWILLAQAERIKTHSFVVWNKLDQGIEKLANSSEPVDFENLSMIKLSKESAPPPNFGSLLFTLMSALPRQLDRGQSAFEDAIQESLCAHLSWYKISTDQQSLVSSFQNPKIFFGNRYVEFLEVPKQRISYFHEILSALKPSLSMLLNTFEELSNIQQLKREAAIGSLASSVAHDIRSPLSALNLAVAGMDRSPQRARNLIESASARINDIAEDLLNMNRYIDTKTLDIINLDSLSHNIVNEKLVEFQHRKDLEVDVFCKESLKALMTINIGSLQRVLSNLLNNSIEACQVRGKVAIKISQEGSHCIIRITDNGVGIAPEKIESVWIKGESFARKRGTGLGLSHAKEAIEKVGGKIRLTSQLNEGTTVLINIPVSEWQ